jgi:hypothetical protein
MAFGRENQKRTLDCPESFVISLVLGARVELAHP